MRPALLLSTLLALALAGPAGASHRSGHIYCGPTAGAGPQSGGEHYYRHVHTYSLSCRKGLRIVRAFHRRHGAPPREGRYTTTVSRFRYRCKANFGYHPSGAFVGGVTCRRNGRRVSFAGAHPSGHSGSGPPPPAP